MLAEYWHSINNYYAHDVQTSCGFLNLFVRAQVDGLGWTLQK
jgi:hypothetical protein